MCIESECPRPSLYCLGSGIVVTGEIIGRTTRLHYFSEVLVASVLGVLLRRHLPVQFDLTVVTHQREFLHVCELTTRPSFTRKLGGFYQHPLVRGGEDRLDAAALKESIDESKRGRERLNFVRNTHRDVSMCLLR